MDRWEALARIRLVWRWATTTELHRALDALITAAGVSGCHGHTQERVPGSPEEALRLLNSALPALVEGRPALAAATVLTAAVWAHDELEALGAHAPKVEPAEAPGEPSQ